jgi:RND family efflux transporter MFP subunit
MRCQGERFLPGPRLRGAVLLLLGALAAGCNGGPAEKKPTPQGEAAPVQVVRPVRKVLRKVVEQPGSVRGDEEASLYARATGFVRAVPADIGQEVQAGAVLAEIDVPDLEQEAKQKQGMVKLAKAEVEQANKALAAAEAAIVAAEAQKREADAALGRAQALYDRWSGEYERISRLVRDRVLDRQSGDEAEHQFKASAAARDEARARIGSAAAAADKARADRDKAAADVRAAAARQEVAEADSARLQELLRFARIRAPFDGVVVRRAVDRGDFVQPGGKAAPLFVVARIDRVRVLVDVPESDAPLIRQDTPERDGKPARKGTPARVRVQALPGAEWVGSVSRASVSLDPGPRTLRVEIDLDNADRRLQPGLYALARLEPELPEAWVLPAAALVKQGEQTVCFRIVEGKAVRTLVKAGPGDGGSVTVLGWQKPDGGWKEWTGAEEVAAGAANLVDGQAVEVARPGP